jgi:hypothetical protein
MKITSETTSTGNQPLKSLAPADFAATGICITPYQSEQPGTHPHLAAH